MKVVSDKMKTSMESSKQEKAVIYARVSSKEQEETGYSLEAQIKLLDQYALEKSYKVAKVFRVAESASKSQIRKTLAEMLSYCEKNGVRIILCEKIDRLTRNLKDAAIIDDWIHASEKREVHFVKEHFLLNEHTRAHDNFVWDMKVAVARFYTNNLSEEVRKGQKEKASQGWLPTKPPLGYITTGDKGHKIHLPDENVAPFIRNMFELYATGNYSTPSLSKKLYALGFRSRNGGRVGKSQVHKLLTEPFYCGKFVWKGQEYQGGHEPLISRTLFEQVGLRLSRPNAPYHNKHLKELRGKILCGECFKTVTWERQKGHWYGACKQCKAQLAAERKYVRYEEVENRLLDHIASISPKSDRVLEVLKKALKESHSEEIAYHDTQVKAINSSLERIKQRLKTMYEDRLDGRIAAEEYDQRVREFSGERETLTESLKRLNSDNTEYYKVGIAIHELALKARNIYQSEKASLDERRALLAYAFDSVQVLKGKVAPEFTKGFSFLVQWMPKVNASLEPGSSPANILALQAELSESISEHVTRHPKASADSRTAEKPCISTIQGLSQSQIDTLLPG